MQLVHFLPFGILNLIIFRLSHFTNKVIFFLDPSKIILVFIIIISIIIIIYFLFLFLLLLM